MFLLQDAIPTDTSMQLKLEDGSVGGLTLSISKSVKGAQREQKGAQIFMFVNVFNDMSDSEREQVMYDTVYIYVYLSCAKSARSPKRWRQQRLLYTILYVLHYMV